MQHACNCLHAQATFVRKRSQAFLHLGSINAIPFQWNYLVGLWFWHDRFVFCRWDWPVALRGKESLFAFEDFYADLRCAACSPDAQSAFVQSELQGVYKSAQALRQSREETKAAKEEFHEYKASQRKKTKKTTKGSSLIGLMGSFLCFAGAAADPSSGRLKRIFFQSFFNCPSRMQIKEPTNEFCLLSLCCFHSKLCPNKYDAAAGLEQPPNVTTLSRELMQKHVNKLLGTGCRLLSLEVSKTWLNTWTWTYCKRTEIFAAVMARFSGEAAAVTSYVDNLLKRAAEQHVLDFVVTWSLKFNTCGLWSLCRSSPRAGHHWTICCWSVFSPVCPSSGRKGWGWVLRTVLTVVNAL